MTRPWHPCIWDVENTYDGKDFGEMWSFENTVVGTAAGVMTTTGGPSAIPPRHSNWH